MLINVQLAHPSVRIVAFADDSAFNDAPAALYPAFVTKCEIQRDLLGLEENMTKIIAFSNGGDMRLAPPHIPGAARHRDGVVGGAKIAGCFHGDTTTSSTITGATTMKSTAAISTGEC